MPPNIQFVPPPAGSRRQQSDLVLAGRLAFASGVLPIDMGNDTVALPESVEGQARKILNNLDALLSAHGLSREQVLSVQVWLRDFHRFHERFEKVWPEFFPAARQPARQTVGVIGLPRGALVSMDFVIAGPAESSREGTT
jgi:enamine deaminase RidA (YjgF/YER057c/UK114 family)